MAVSDAIKKATGNGAPSAPVTPQTPAPKAGATQGSGLGQAFKQEGAKARESMTDDERALEGSKSHTLEFICALGDPSSSQSRKEGNTYVPCKAVIGAKFRFLEDAMCPYAPLKENCANTTDTVPLTEVQVHAGDVVALNLTEYAALLAKVEYAGRATGGSTPVMLGCTVRKDGGFPLPQLNLTAAKGSYKENMEMVAEAIGGENGTRKSYKVREEYAEKFGAWYNKKSMSKGSASAPKKKGEASANIAAAFRIALAKKAAGQM